MSKIHLFSLRSPFLADDRIYPPLGLLYLKSALNFRGHEAIVHDDFNPNDIPAYTNTADMIGFSVMTPQREDARKALKQIKSYKKNFPVVIGGPHATHYWQQAREDSWDFIVKGDGERSLPRILDKDLTDRISSDTIGWRDLKEFPRPDRLGEASLLSRYHYVLNGRESTTMLTGRGCVEHCTFCEERLTTIRWSSYDNIQKELEDIVELGYGGVYIFDDLFAIAKSKVEPIVRMMHERDLIYRCNGQARYMNPAFADLLKETGCAEIAFGAESFSQRILDNVRKRTTVEDNYRFIDLMHERDIPVKAFVMLGLPGETFETLKETERALDNLGDKLVDIQFAIFYPYRGTQIRESIEEGDRSLDLYFIKEGLGAYGQKNAETDVVVRTNALRPMDLLAVRNRWISKYKPVAHKDGGTNFHDYHLVKGGIEYESE